MYLVHLLRCQETYDYYIAFLMSLSFKFGSKVSTSDADSLKEWLVAGFLCPFRPLDGSVHRHKQLREPCEEVFARFVYDLSCLRRPEEKISLKCTYISRSFREENNRKRQWLAGRKALFQPSVVLV